MSKDTTTHSEDQELASQTQAVSWQEAKERFQAQAVETKPRTYNIGTKDEPVPITFTLRMLSQRQKDRIEEEATKHLQLGRGDQEEVSVDLGSVKKNLIREGVQDGPDGWKGTDGDVYALPAWIRDDLADSVQEFHTLKPDARVGFR